MISQRGEIWWVDLDPVRGKEQAKTRPAVVVSRPDAANMLGLAVVAPLTTRNRGWLWHVKVPAVEGTGLRRDSYLMTEQIRSVDIQSRVGRRIGQVDAETLDEIDRKIASMLGRSI